MSIVEDLVAPEWRLGYGRIGVNVGASGSRGRARVLGGVAQLALPGFLCLLMLLHYERLAPLLVGQHVHDIQALEGIAAIVDPRLVPAVLLYVADPVTEGPVDGRTADQYWISQV